jgi:hypothetical protein
MMVMQLAITHNGPYCMENMSGCQGTKCRLNNTHRHSHGEGTRVLLERDAGIKKCFRDGRMRYKSTVRGLGSSQSPGQVAIVPARIDKENDANT